MARISKEERRKQALIDAEWYLTVLEALKSYVGDMAPVLERIARQAGDAGDLRGLRMITRDLVAVARDLPSSELDALNSVLLLQFGRDLRTADDKERRAVSNILKRGRLRNDEEFRFLKEQLDDQGKADKLEQTDIERIDQILAAHEREK